MKKSLAFVVIAFGVAALYWLNHAQAKVTSQQQVKWEYAQLNFHSDIASFSFLTADGEKDGKSYDELYTAMTGKESKGMPVVLALMNAAGADGWEYIERENLAGSTFLRFKRPAQ
jgi:hypothetical protein